MLGDGRWHKVYYRAHVVHACTRGQHRCTPVLTSCHVCSCHSEKTAVTGRTRHVLCVHHYDRIYSIRRLLRPKTLNNLIFARSFVTVRYIRACGACVAQGNSSRFCVHAAPGACATVAICMYTSIRCKRLHARHCTFSLKICLFNYIKIRGQ
jgi:hypothetical protein